MDKMKEPIQLSPQSEIFIAVCKYYGHSYVTLGVKTGDKTEVLAAVGKLGKQDSATLCGLICNGVDAIVQNESFMFGPHTQRTVAYKAYMLSYQQYLEFLHYLKLLSLSQKSLSDSSTHSLKAYCPTPERKELLTWQSLDTYDSKEPTGTYVDLYEYSKLSLSNTCRHSAIRMVQQASKCAELSSSISSFFFTDLPSNADFLKGQVAKSTPYFYILPLPPSSFRDMPWQKQSILETLYQRLDDMCLSEQMNPVTFQKFSKLKALYLQLTSKEKASVFDVLEGIETWEKENKALISTHRKDHWISFQTATEKMFAYFHQEFKHLRDDLQHNNAL